MDQTQSSINDRDESFFLVMQGLKEFCKAVNNGRYFVRRGTLSWAEFDFGKHPYAISILCDDRSFFRSINTMTITLEMFQRMPSSASDVEMSDEGLSDLSHDAFKVFYQLLSLKRKKSNDALVLRHHKESDNLIESSDVSLRIEGVVATIKIDVAE